MSEVLPHIPNKKYFAIGEASRLCDVKPHVLRYWEQEFIALQNVNRRSNRRYYERRHILLIRRIRSLLYDKGFTIEGAKNFLMDEEKNQNQSTAQPVQTASLPPIISELEDILDELRTVSS